jgi:hypothetical protein
MGCWNGTCAISKLPIIHGDRVLCWFINTPLYGSVEANLSAKNFCYPNDRYELLGVPFRAQYNDYGGFEDVVEEDMPIIDMIIAEMRESLVEIPLGENECHDIAVTKDSLDLELIQEAMHEGRLMIKGWGDEARSVGLMMIHEHLFEEMIANFQWDDYADVDGQFKRFKAKFDVQKKMAEIASAIDADNRTRFGFGNMTRRYMDKITFASSINMEFADKGVPTNHPLYQQFILGLVYNNILDHLFHRLRMSYGPQCGAGSQDQEYEVYECLMDAMKSTIKKTKDERGWNDDEDEEDDE